MHLARPSGRVVVAILAGALAASTMTASAATPQPLATPPSCQGGWLSAPNPLTATSGTVLDLVAGPLGPWVVGIGQAPASWRPVPTTAHWDGSQWNTVALPELGKPAALFSIAARGTSELWAVGELDGTRTNPLIERYAQGVWHTMATPALPNGASLTGVAAWGTARAWTVGYTAAPGGPRTLALRWNGTAWKLASPPAIADSALTGVAGVAANDTWAVGWVKSTTGFRPLIEHWNGSAWTRTRPAGVGGPDAVLTSVTVRSPKDAWAVGYQGAQGAWRPLVLRWDGLSWKNVLAPVPPVPVSMSLLRSVAATPGGIIAVGAAWDDSKGTTRSMLARWDGIAWDVTVDVAGVGKSDLVSISSDATTTWIVGRGSTGGLTIRTCVADGSRAIAATGGAALGTPTGLTQNALQDETELTPRAAPVSAPAAVLAPPVVPPPGLEVREVATEAGMAFTSQTYGGVATDLDGDGWPDLLVGRHGASPWIGRNVNGHFEETLQGQIPKGDRHGCAVGDVDGDFTPDIACMHGAGHGMAIKRNELFLSPWTRPIVDVATPWGIADPLGRGRQVSLFDANHDGLLDIYVTNDPSRIDGLPSLNHLYLNVGDKRFVPAPQAGLDLPIGGTCAVPGDLDGDGWTDLVLCHFVPEDGTSGIMLFHNTGGHFTDITAASGIIPLGESDAAIADMNGDGQPDIVQLAARRLRVALQDHGVFRTGLNVAVSYGRSVGVGDADGNGTRDLYVVNGKVGTTNAPDLMLLNSGNGVRFTSIIIPQTTLGSGDSVVPIDFDRNGKTDFVVLNGFLSVAGPVQLIAFGPPWPASTP